jgi:hypothetical protein
MDNTFTMNNINFNKANKSPELLDIKGFNTVSTKAEEADNALDIEQPKKYQRNCYVSRREKIIFQLSSNIFF